ncbi:MAG: TRAP transporter small permease [Comamonas sp.]
MKSWFDRALLGLHTIGAATLFVLVVVIAYDVLGRLLFNRPFPGTTELTSAGLVLLTFLQAPHAIREGKLLRVTFFLDRVPPMVRSALEVLAWSIGGAIFLVFVAAGWDPAFEGWKSAEFFGNDAFRLPASPLRFSALVLWLVGAAVCIGFVVEALSRRVASPSASTH